MAAMYNPTHPGEILLDALQAESLGVSDAAARLGVTVNTLSRVGDGADPVSPRLASTLQDLGWSDAGHWLRTQRAFDLAKARKTDALTSPDARQHQLQP